MTLDNATRMLAQHPGQRLQAIVQGQQLGNQRRNQDMEGAMNALGMLLKTWEAKKGRDYQKKRDTVADASNDREFGLKQETAQKELALRLKEFSLKKKMTQAEIRQMAQKYGLEEKYYDLALTQDKRKGRMDDLSFEFETFAMPLRMGMLSSQAQVAEGEPTRVGEKHTSDMLGAQASRLYQDAGTAGLRENTMASAQARNQSAELHPYALETASYDPRRAAAGLDQVRAQTGQINAETAAIPQRIAQQWESLGIENDDALMRWDVHLQNRDNLPAQRALMESQIANLDANTTLTEAQSVGLSNQVTYELNVASAKKAVDMQSALQDRVDHLDGIIKSLYGTDAGFPLGSNEERDAYQQVLFTEKDMLMKALDVAREWTGSDVMKLKADIAAILKGAPSGAGGEASGRILDKE